MELIKTDLYVIAMNDVLDYIDTSLAQNDNLRVHYEDAGIDSHNVLDKLKQAEIVSKHLKYSVEGMLGNYLMKNQTKLIKES